MAKKDERRRGLHGLLELLRVHSVIEYEGPLVVDQPSGPQAVLTVKLKLAPLAPALTGKVIGPAERDPPPALPKELAAAGLTPDQYAAIMDRAADLTS